MPRGRERPRARERALTPRIQVARSRDFSSTSAGGLHGYVRYPDGAITVFDAPGAVATFPAFSSLLINPRGQITGYYTDANGASHGFLRETDGTFATFDVPGADQGTFPFAISQRGDITGYYFDGAGVGHGFLRDRNGVITTFDVPGAGTEPGQGTYGGGFTASGVIMGNYFDPDNISHGFLRDRHGNFTSYDAPGAGSVPDSFQGTYPFGVNPHGGISGWYVDESDVNHGFVRGPNGQYITFDVPGAGTGPGQGPYVFGIAPNGASTGYSYDPDNVVARLCPDQIGGHYDPSPASNLGAGDAKASVRGAGPLTDAIRRSRIEEMSLLQVHLELEPVPRLAVIEARPGSGRPACARRSGDRDWSPRPSARRCRRSREIRSRALCLLCG